MTMQQIASLLKSPIVKMRSVLAQKKLGEVLAHSDPLVRAVGQALTDSLRTTNRPDELNYLRRIEKRRAALLRSEKVVELIDYGAGSSKSERTIEEMKRGITSRVDLADITKSSKQKFWATLLFHLSRNVRPSSSVELGTCVGISAAYQAAALKLNGHGRLITLEGSPELANAANETFRELELQNVAIVTGPFHETLLNAYADARPIDLLFNDGHHSEDAVINYFVKAQPFLSDPALVVIDDISWSAGMKRAWKRIEENIDVKVSIDLGTMGLALLSGRITEKRTFRILLQ